MGIDEAQDTAEAQSLSIEMLMPLIYTELRALARRERHRFGGMQTLSTTALVNEAYLRLVGNPAFASRSDFLRISACAMRRVLIDRVREQRAEKRGGGAAHLSIEQAEESAGDFIVENDASVIAVDDALSQLGTLNPRLVQVVECRFFAGYTDLETAKALGISERSVQSDWALARAWVRNELGVGKSAQR